MKKYVNYKDIPAMCGVEKGDIVLVSSDITRMGYQYLERGEVFDANILIDAFIERLGNSGVLLFPVYNWDFCHGVPFDYKKTRGKTGFLGNAALKRRDFRRTKHPIYSFAVWGKDKEYLHSLENTDSFAPDSPFGYLYKNHAKSLSIDAHFNHYYTFCHYVEQAVKVPFRYMKNFTGKYIDESGNVTERTYGMYVRNLDINLEGDATLLYERLLELGVAREKIIDGITCSLIDIYKSYEPIADDLINNKGRLQVQYKGQDS